MQERYSRGYEEKILYLYNTSPLVGERERVQTVGRVRMYTGTNYRSPMGAGLAARGERRADCPRGWCPNSAPTFRLLSFLPGGLRDWFRARPRPRTPSAKRPPPKKKLFASFAYRDPGKVLALSSNGSLSVDPREHAKFCTLNHSVCIHMAFIALNINGISGIRLSWIFNRSMIVFENFTHIV